jgi:hypothetical protein
VSIQCLEPFFRTDLNHHTPAAIKAPLQKPWQRRFKRLPLKVIEEDFAQATDYLRFS